MAHPAIRAVDEVATCLPVVQEVVQGFADERARRLAREAMRALPIVESPLRLEVVDAAPAQAHGLLQQKVLVEHKTCAVCA